MEVSGLLLLCAIGDALGAGCEYADEKIPEVLNFTGYIQHPTHTGLKPGMYTDDTQMSLALAELMIEEDTWDADKILKKFYLCYKRDPRDGYSRGFQKILDNSPHVEGLKQNLKGNSDKSGAAMRAAVVGLYKNEDDVFLRTVEQASVTHHSKIGISSALIVAYSAHALYYKKVAFNFQSLMDYLKSKIGDLLYIDEEIRYPLPLKAEEKIQSKGYWAPCAAITDMFEEFAKNSNGCLKQVRKLISRGGDTDTACAIMMSLLACAKDKLYVTKELYEGLENGGYGRDYLINIDNQLRAKFPRP